MMNYWHVQQHGQISEASVKKARLQRLHTVWVHLQARLSGHKTDPWLPGAGLGVGVVDCKEAQGTFWSDALYLCLGCDSSSVTTFVRTCRDAHWQWWILVYVNYTLEKLGENNQDSANQNKSVNNLYLSNRLIWKIVVLGMGELPPGC